MGADFLVAWLPSCSITADRKVELNTIIDNLTDADFANTNGSARFDDIEEWRERLSDRIDELAGGRLCGRDCCDAFRLPGADYPIDISGGMSHGDSPTEAYELMDEIADCPPLFYKLEAWAKEDAKRVYPPAVQELVDAARALLVDAIDRGENGPPLDGDYTGCPQDEDGNYWHDDYFALREALKPFQPKATPAPTATP